jgi:hypothetical protein
VINLRDFVFQVAKNNQLLLGTTNPTSTTHCKNVFTQTATTAAKLNAEVTPNYYEQLYTTIFTNWHDYMTADEQVEETK